MIPIIDTHCDALLKLQSQKRDNMTKIDDKQPLNFTDDTTIDTNLTRLQTGSVKTQCFAIFIEPDIPAAEKWQHALEQIDVFYEEILGKHAHVKHIKNWQDLHHLKEDEIGAALTLEGADAFGNDLTKLRTLYRLGVLSIGLTWNNANLCADGAGEPRGGGLTLLGKEVVALNNEHRVFTDVSHLTVAGFWDVMALADYPFASHSNARAICDHPRNLYDNQIEAMFKNNGFIDVVFAPPFISADKQTVTIDDLLTHIDHLCSLGGEKHVGFGSDFDGIDEYVQHLEDASQYQHLIEALLKHYNEDQVRGFAYQNFMNHLPTL